MGEILLTECMINFDRVERTTGVVYAWVTALTVVCFSLLDAGPKSEGVEMTSKNHAPSTSEDVLRQKYETLNVRPLLSVPRSLLLFAPGRYEC